MPTPDPSRRPEPIPAQYAGALSGVTSGQLVDLATSTSQSLADGRESAEIVDALVQAGWDKEFASWYVAVYASGGSVVSTPPASAPPFAGYPRAAAIEEKGNWWDKQAAPYKEGSGSLWFHVICCQCPGVIIALLFIAFCQTETGKANGKRLLIYSLAGFAVAFVLRILITLMAISSQGGR